MSGFEENEFSLKSNGGTQLSCRLLQKHIDQVLLRDTQIIPSRVSKIEEDKIRIYYVHETPEFGESKHLKDKQSRDRFHKIVFVSHWQLNEYVSKLGLPQDDKLTVIENPIEPFSLVEKASDEIRLVYFSAPHRGLVILVTVFEALSKKYGNIVLDVYSSFELYGWMNKDQEFASLFNRIKDHPRMNLRGYLPQHELRKEIEKSHILAYPSNYPETSCRVLIEAMSAGLECVHPNLGALAETSGGLTTIYQFESDIDRHARSFLRHLDRAIVTLNEPESRSRRQLIKQYADTKFGIAKISAKWSVLLRELHAIYPDAKSRMPAPAYSYSFNINMPPPNR